MKAKYFILFIIWILPFIGIAQVPNDSLLNRWRDTTLSDIDRVMAMYQNIKVDIVAQPMIKDFAKVTKQQ